MQHIFFALNERMEILTIFYQNHGLTFLEKFWFFAFLNFVVFFSVERRFFFLEYRETHFLNLFFT